MLLSFRSKVGKVLLFCPIPNDDIPLIGCVGKGVKQFKAYFFMRPNGAKVTGRNFGDAIVVLRGQLFSMGSVKVV